MKTSLQELNDYVHLDDEINTDITLSDIVEKIGVLLEKEKQQIIKAYDEASSKICLKCDDFKIGDEYYKENYEK